MIHPRWPSYRLRAQPRRVTRCTMETFICQSKRTTVRVTDVVGEVPVPADRHLVPAVSGSPARGTPGGAAAAPCSFIWSGFSNDLLSLHGNRGLIPWGSRICCAILGARPSNAGRGLSAPRNGCARRDHPPALGLCRKPARARARMLHSTLGICRLGPSPQPRHERCRFFYGVDQLANTFLFYLFVFPSGRAWTFASRPASVAERRRFPSVVSG